ncbi:long-chain-fatty-acid--CoA ligase ACSBG2 isoform X3 [Panthera tigris]|uniref:long-chain-fatty-acid--CoA ligase ACSBG2 isoform X3 n=1 Tax=Panthera tigris TaxID=9694 RepID=UPI001C6F6F08|nr:long-chain-fatty-acid--CoA ligase ACSBG2 isoform X3 [Panthera tigris]
MLRWPGLMTSGSAVKNGLSGPGRAKLPMAHEEETGDPELDMSDTKVTPGLWTIHQDGEVLLRLSKHGPGHETPVTIPAFFRESVSRFGAYPALATKNSERWETLNFNQYYEACRKAARALIKLGLQRFHGVGILGFNSVEWFIASVGAILAGGLCVGIYSTNSADACQYVITHAKVNILLVENDLQLQKILSIPRGRMDTLKAIIQYKLPMKESRDNLYSWNDFMELGNSIPDSQLDQIVESQRPNQCAVIIYTSGTLGIPKGVMLSHDNNHSYLPLSHIAAQMMDIWVTMKIGASTYFAQPDALKGTLINTLQEVKPTAFLGVPRIWEKMQERIKETGAKFSSLRKKVFSWGRVIGFKINTKGMLGCGKVMDGCKNMLYQKNKDSIGEICIWGRHVFMGYLDMEDRTVEIIDDEGWLHTGDLGYTDNQGFLYITGRIKEILITAGGENVAPIPIENMVKEKIPMISHAMLVGEKANFLSILLTLKKMDGITGEPLDELSSEAINFCRKLGSHVSTVSEILELRDPLVYKAIQEGIDAVNEEAISDAQRIQKWAILEKDFSVPSGELGPTTKVRRHFVAQKYKRLIESFYH